MSNGLEGQLIGGRFRVEGLLGTGGMGAVYLARNLGLDQLVAIKVLHPDVAQDDVRRSRLIREARVAARIKSPHVVRMLDVVAEGPDAPFVVMERLEGESLRQRLDQRGRLSFEEVLELLAQIGQAVGEGHTLGVVHRDLKPENVFCVRQPDGAPFYKVLDFGISKLRSAEAETLTSSRQVLASPAYASPEQLRQSRDADVQADIWSLGVTIYECLVGQRPFTGETLGHLCVQILEHAPPAPSTLVAGLPPAVDRIILRCLEKTPELRFASVLELLRACAVFAPHGYARALAYLEHAAPPTAPRASALGSPSPPVTPARQSERISRESSPPSRDAERSLTLTATEAAAVVSAPSAMVSRPRRRQTARVGAGVAALAAVGVGLWLARSVLLPTASPTAATSSSAAASVLAEPPFAQAPAMSPSAATPAPAPTPSAAAAASLALASATPTAGARPSSMKVAAPARPPASGNTAAPRVPIAKTASRPLSPSPDPWVESR